MARTSTSAAATKRPAIEVKALAASTKSEGMRMLFADGYTVNQVAKVYKAPYGFAYGVAQRGGFAETAAQRKAPKAKATATPSKSKASAKGKASAVIARVPKGAKITSVTVTKVAGSSTATKRVAARLAAKATAKAGRPTAERRAANRKPRAAAKA